MRPWPKSPMAKIPRQAAARRVAVQSNWPEPQTILAIWARSKKMPILMGALKNMIWPKAMENLCSNALVSPAEWASDILGNTAVESETAMALTNSADNVLV